MSLSILMLIVFLAGALGGIVNALLSDNGFLLPRSESTGTTTIIRPGVLGNALTGAVAASISWGLYGPYPALFIVGGPQPTGEASQVGLTVSALVGAILVGVGGAKWLSNEVDKNLLKAAASAAASSEANTEKAKRISGATPADALRIALS